MSWKLFGSTFTAIFIAEVGDKTQLAAFALAGSNSQRWTVFFAASLALICATAIAVLAGGIIGRYIPAIWLKRGAGVVFLVMGILFLLSKPEAPAEASPSGPSPAGETRQEKPDQ